MEFNFPTDKFKEDDQVLYPPGYDADYVQVAYPLVGVFLDPSYESNDILPGDLGERIKTAFNARYPGNIIGVGPRILFAYKYLEAECKNAAFQKSLRNLDFCKEIPIPGYYKETEKKYGIRKATTYKGKPHPSHVRIDKSNFE